MKVMREGCSDCCPEGAMAIYVAVYEDGSMKFLAPGVDAKGNIVYDTVVRCPYCFQQPFLRSRP